MSSWLGNIFTLTVKEACGDNSLCLQHRNVISAILDTHAHVKVIVSDLKAWCVHAHIMIRSLCLALS